MWMNFCACSAIALTTSGCDDAGRVDGDAGGAVEEPVAVDVFDHRAFAAGDHERIVAGVGRRHELASRSMIALAFGPGSAVLMSGAFMLAVSVLYLRFHRVAGRCPRG